MVIVIDNYDSFVYNLARYVSELGYARAVFRNDAISIQTIEQLRPSHLILSPGPCTPDTAGICLTLVQHFTNHIPILGVCLGHQIIGQAFGSRIGQAQHPMHGMSCDITHTQQGIFQNLPNPLTVGRYHSLIIETNTLPSCLTTTAYSQEQEIMAIAHTQAPVFGVQFHPESILTPYGHSLIENFLQTC